MPIVTNTARELLIKILQNETDIKILNTFKEESEWPPALIAEFEHAGYLFKINLINVKFHYQKVTLSVRFNSYYLSETAIEDFVAKLNGRVKRRGFYQTRYLHFEGGLGMHVQDKKISRLIKTIHFMISQLKSLAGNLHQIDRNLDDTFNNLINYVAF